MIALLLLYPIYATVMYANQTALLFPAASGKHHPLDANLPDDGRLIEIPASFGKVRAVYLRTPKTSDHAAAIIYLHGNFECIEDSFAVLQPLVAADIPVLQVEFPGFCGADGKPTFPAINEATDLSYDWLVKQPDVDPAKILVMGYSIGGGAGLPKFLIHYPYDTLARVREFKGPVFIEHGRLDKVIPFAMGTALAGSNASSEFVPLDCGHDTCRFDRSVFAERLPAWLAKHHIIERSTQLSSSSQ
jgi:pimeloyl-ACP methyl ester carboxylesterase